jgi:K+-sensing histidine kinase KdpD
VLQEVQFARQDRALLGTFANQAALAVERAQLQEQAMRTRLLEEIDRWRGAMMGAVSHDLRTPLASVKTAVSSLRQDNAGLSEMDRADLLELIELQSDRLARLVTNLLDMTRIESGALAVRRALIPLDELVDESLAAIDGLVPRSRVHLEPSAALAGDRPRADRAGSGQPAGECGAPLPFGQRDSHWRHVGRGPRGTLCRGFGS